MRYLDKITKRHCGGEFYAWDTPLLHRQCSDSCGLDQSLNNIPTLLLTETDSRQRKVLQHWFQGCVSVYLMPELICTGWLSALNTVSHKHMQEINVLLCPSLATHTKCLQYIDFTRCYCILFLYLYTRNQHTL